MLKFVVLIIALLFGTTLLALNAERIMLFHFDPTRVSPAEAGEPRLREVMQDGLVLWVANPVSGKPTVLYFHGNAGNLAGRATRFTKFLDAGFGVVAMAYPGSSGSEGEQGSDAINAFATMVYLRTSELTGTTDIILYGESIGTGVAAHLAANVESEPSAMILEAPYTSILDLGRQRYPRLGPYLHLLGDPWVSRKWIAMRDIPLLIMHGSEDVVIPPEMGRELFALSPTTDKTLHIVEGAGHNNVWQPSAQLVLFDFLAAH